MFTTAGNTFATASTAGSDAGSAWANEYVELAMSAATMPTKPRIRDLPIPSSK
jgi:hypothetical protein